MFRKFILILFVMFYGCVNVSFAQCPTDVRKGYDVLALAKYCSTFLRAPHLPAFSTLLNTFGDPLPCVRKKLSQGTRTEVVQIDLIDATCWRNKKCPQGAPRPDDLSVIKRRASLIQPLAVAYPSTQFWVSPALEHDVRQASTVTRMLQAAKAGCPSCQVINSPFTGAKPSGFPVELHGTKVRAFAVSGDGASSFDGDNLDSAGSLNDEPFNHSCSGTDQSYGWWNELNLRCTGEKDFTAPLARTERPSLDQFRQYFITAQTEEIKPAPPLRVCPAFRDLSAPEIYKPNAESYCNGQKPDVRGNKPLLIIKKGGKKGDKIKVFNKLGKHVGCFQYYGSFTTAGLHRWYMGDCSGQKPAELYDAFGGEWGFVELSKNSCLRINSVRRLGTWR